MDPNEIKQKIIAREWKDSEFRKKLKSHPEEAVKEMGIEMPEGFKIRVVEDDPESYTFVLPPSPANVETLTVTELKSIAGACCGHSNLTWTRLRL